MSLFLLVIGVAVVLAGILWVGVLAFEMIEAQSESRRTHPQQSDGSEEG